MIVNDFMWNMFGKKWIDGFDPLNVNPASYDVSLSEDIIIQRFQGKNYNDEPATLLPHKPSQGEYTDVQHTMLYIPSTQQTYNALFTPGDCFLGSTIEYFHQPSWLHLQFALKSTSARLGLRHAMAGWAEGGFHGNLVMEFDISVAGYVVPNRKVGQMIGHIGFPSKAAYNKRSTSSYKNQKGTVGSNKRTLAFVPERLTKQISPPEPSANLNSHHIG